ncbi:MAG: endoribonuclease MazF [Alphaproteobacteria bacterium]|nr:endoribonuclease MazF [Alphaproteobacteria bacterium]
MRKAISGRRAVVKPGERRYLPDRGHLVWLTFGSVAGHEQSGRRPALVLSPAIYNGRSGLAVCCPITSRVKSYPFEVGIDTAGISGVVLADQVRTLDWRSRAAEYAGQASAATLSEVQARLRALLFD